MGDLNAASIGFTTNFLWSTTYILVALEYLSSEEHSVTVSVKSILGSMLPCNRIVSFSYPRTGSVLGFGRFFDLYK